MYPGWRLCLTFLQIFILDYSMRVQIRAHAISVHFENIVCFEIVYKRMEKNVFVFIKQIKKPGLCSLLF